MKHSNYNVIRDDVYLAMGYNIYKNKHFHNITKVKQMKQVGIIGWRGMVGSVLLQRMLEENDFQGISAHFYSTSSAGAAGPVIAGVSYILKDANCIESLAEMDIIITCPGGRLYPVNLSFVN